MLRVTAQLINVSDGYHIWSDEYDRELSDIFRIQESIARNIARKLNLTISESGERHFELYADKEFEPFELSLKGRSLLQHRIEGIEEAKKCFEKAIALDPEYAPAYADLSITYYWMGIFYFIPPDEAFPLSVVYAKKALRLDPGLTDAHKFIAWSLLYFNWDWATARTEYNKIKVNNNAKDHFFYSIYQAFILEDFDSAVKLAEEILDRDPKSIRSNLNLAFIHLTGRNFEEAQILLNDIISQYPYISEAHRYLGLIHFFRENYDNAVESLNRAIHIAEGKGSAPYYLLCAKAAQRELDENSSIFEHYMVNTPQWYCPARKAMVFMYMGKPDRAFEWMNRAFDHKDYILTSLKVSPDWDAFRNDARFDSLLVKMNLLKEPDL